MYSLQFLTISQHHRPWRIVYIVANVNENKDKGFSKKASSILQPTFDKNKLFQQKKVLWVKFVAVNEFIPIFAQSLFKSTKIMSTRCNVVIKQSDDNYYVLYHHYDGYPNGVGRELPKLLERIDAGHASSPERLAKKINALDSSYEDEENGTIAPDIEYLYVIDLSDKKIRCYSVDGVYKHTNTQLDYICGRAKQQELVFEISLILKSYTGNYESQFNDLLTTVKKLKLQVQDLQMTLDAIIDKYN